MTDELQWLQWRQRGVGASDSPAILGVCPHRTRLAVYLEKVGTAKPSPPSEAKEWGLRLEPVIAAAYAERVGLLISERQVQRESKEHPWLRATLDLVAEDGRIVELKALGLWKAQDFRAASGDWRALPQNMLVQLHHQMIVAEQEWADLAVFLPLELRIFSVPRDETLCDLIVDETREFWGCVQDREPPRTLDPRDHDRISLAFPKAEGSILLDDPRLVDAAEAFRRSKDKAAKVALLDAMGEAASAVLADGRTIRRKVAFRKAYTVAEATVVTLEIEERSMCNAGPEHQDV